jgi:uncharacterized protein with PIN domain
MMAGLAARATTAANLVEIGIVMQARRGDDRARDLDLLLAKLKSTQRPSRRVTLISPARRFGAGAVDAMLSIAKDKSAPLLFKGDQTPHVMVALY